MPYIAAAEPKEAPFWTSSARAAVLLAARWVTLGGSRGFFAIMGTVPVRLTESGYECSLDPTVRYPTCACSHLRITSPSPHTHGRRRYSGPPRIADEESVG